ncbi:DUF2075 domain-containing protein [Gluconobacter albidus]|uniref:DNA/RNA helicase domain-containing protein n=1 Tax=Gluconobacter albidus TaxID=318683 RepID=UPI0020A04BD3|nr:DNA/RNA helicase domain-containing protein [Gluconobacter albidus]MCP1272540.1 DUF2075 domain-containing protein [Gluconobacter albidus]
MGAWWSGSVTTFLHTPPDQLCAALAHKVVQNRFQGEPQQARAWGAQIDLLRNILQTLPNAQDWQVLFEFPIPRLGGRIDTVLVSPGAIYVLEFKIGSSSFDAAALSQTEGYALDLLDFHAASRKHPLVPVLVATDAPSRAQTTPLLLPLGVTEVQCVNAAGLKTLLTTLAAQTAHTDHPLVPAQWEHAPYDPVPSIVEAARQIYATHSVADIHTARADATNLTQTSACIASILDTARTARRKVIVFVSGIPGAGKTLCGLKAAFADGSDATGATFLTGNPTLVSVLREALTRDTFSRGQKRLLVEQRMESTIQSLTKFRDHYVGRPEECPPEQIMVIDEAQRCWTQAQAVRKSTSRHVKLTDSEPAHLLDIMGRHEGFAAILCLIGHGQEINDGEGGLACWGEALLSRPVWSVEAAPDVIGPGDLTHLPSALAAGRQRFLHLGVAIRSLREEKAPRWVNAVLNGDVETARSLAGQTDLPFRLTRSLDDLRAGLRHRSRLTYRCGLVASSKAKRLRAEGLGCEVPHMDDKAVSQWFLNRWVPDRDIRASDALETYATEFAIQGLELDFVGLCWDGDLIRASSDDCWQPRRFSGTKWANVKSEETALWRLNTYRVLLTRARYETLIWVPQGSADDPTRDPETLDRIADFLMACGVPLLGTVADTAPPFTVQNDLADLLSG